MRTAPNVAAGPEDIGADTQTHDAYMPRTNVKAERFIKDMQSE